MAITPWIGFARRLLLSKFLTIEGQKYYIYQVAVK